jgi:hypothetical protein
MSYKCMAAQEKAVEAAKYENSKKTARLAVYQKYGTPRGNFGGVVPSDANNRMISDIINRFVDYNDQVLHSLELFEAAIEANPAEFNCLHKKSEKDIRADLVEEIIELLRTRGKAHSEFSLKSERTRLTTFTIPMLYQRLEDLRRAAGLASQSIQTLKQIVADGRPDQSQWPQLPRQMWDSAAGRHVDVNREYLKGLDAFSLKRMLRLYGPQVNQRLAEG